MSILLPHFLRIGTTFPNTRVARTPLRFLRHDPVDGGPHDVSGVVTIQGAPTVPASRRVRLHDRLSGRPVRETWSAADGTYLFPKLRAGSWYVIGFDHLGNYNAVVRDQIATG